jgi:hypothetical protein
MVFFATKRQKLIGARTKFLCRFAVALERLGDSIKIELAF